MKICQYKRSCILHLNLVAILVILHLGLLSEDISPAQIHRADLTSVVFFLLSFVAIYSLNETYIFILVFSDPILFSLSFPVFYFPCLLLSIFFLCLSLHILYFLFLSFLSVFYFLSCCLLSFSSDFLCLSSNFSLCFYLFLCLLLSFLAFNLNCLPDKRSSINYS